MGSKGGGGDVQQVKIHTPEQQEMQRKLLDFLGLYVGQPMEQYPAPRVAGLSPIQQNVYGAVGGKGRQPQTGAVQVPAFQYGGLVTKPTLGVLGEAGPEAVVPLGGKNKQQSGQQRQNVGQKQGAPQPATPLAAPVAQSMPAAQAAQPGVTGFSYDPSQSWFGNIMGLARQRAAAGQPGAGGTGGGGGAVTPPPPPITEPPPAPPPPNIADIVSGVLPSDLNPQQPYSMNLPPQPGQKQSTTPAQDLSFPVSGPPANAATSGSVPGGTTQSVSTTQPVVNPGYDALANQYMQTLMGTLTGQEMPGVTESAQNYFQTNVADPAIKQWQEQILPSLTHAQATQGQIGMGEAQRARERMATDLMTGLNQAQANFVYQTQEGQRNRALQGLGTTLGTGDFLRQLGLDERGIEQQALDTAYQQWLMSLPYNHPAIQMLAALATSTSYQPVTTTGGGKK